MSGPDNIAVAAKRLYEAHETRAPCQPVRDLVAEDDMEPACAVQNHNTARLILRAPGRRA